MSWTSNASSAEGDAMLSVKDAGRSYGETVALNGVSFSVMAGEAMAVVGRNGAGKSTLLKCIVGAETLDEGVVHIRGRALDESDSDVRGFTASLLDDMDFFPDISLVEHLRLFAWLHGTDDAETVVQSTVSDLGLRGIQDQLPPTLSSGQRHRLGLASCFVRRRELLVLDEPEQRLDGEGRLWLQERLLKEKRDGCAIVFASHDSVLVAAVADSIVEIDL